MHLKPEMRKIALCIGFCDKGFFLEFWVTGSFLGTLAHIKYFFYCANFDRPKPNYFFPDTV